ncbi:FtsX-like permease family protein [Candidatus Dojkabacteria bacterium]|nr:FtsX-like permease family protein [Candidatus Dojkabacteria bacterium]
MKMLIKLFRSSLKNILTNKLRSVLTVLGMVIGIASVTIMVSVGESAKKWIEDSLNSTLGTNVMFLIPGSEEDSNSFDPTSFFAMLEEDDYEIFENETIEGITAHSRRNVDTQEITYRSKSENVLTFIHDIGYAEVFDVDFTSGRNFTEKDAQTRKKYIIIDTVIEDKFFPLQEPVGKEIEVEGKTFEIIGVVDDPNQDPGGSGDATASIFMLMDTYSQVFNQPIEYDVISFRIQNFDEKDEIEAEIIRKLKDKRGLAPQDEADFNIQSQEDFLETSSEITDMITTFLTVIASISLIVAGIGVMNIMLVSVNERIKEIGLRKAIGAKNRDILVQFMMESIIYSIIGGVTGLILGSIIAIILEKLAKLPELISITAVVSSLSVSVLIGTVFGVYPAQRAAKLSPIEALRAE